MKAIIQWIKNNYPNVNYKWLIDKAERAIHYGFNLTKLPQKVANKIDYLGFRLVDLNFPLSWFSLEIEESLDDAVAPYNITYIKIPKANLVFSFEDLYPYGYSVEHINSTYILIGNVKNKTDLFLDPITFSSNTITVTGYTEGTPCTFWDLWNASDANGWDIVNNTCDTQFKFWCKLQIGDGSTATWFKDTEKQVSLAYSPTVHYEDLIEVMNNAHFTLGDLKDATDKVGYKGCAVYIPSYYYQVYVIDRRYGATCEVNLYGSTFIAESTSDYRIIRTASGSKVYDCLLSGAVSFQTMPNADMNDIYIIDCDIGLQYVTGTLNRISILNVNRFIITRGGTLTNLYGRNPVLYAVRVYSPSSDTYLVDADLDEWTFSWSSAGSYKVYRQYTFGLTVTYPNGTAINGTETGARVTIQHYGQGGGIDLNATLGADGTITQQTLSKGFYNQTGGNTIYSYEPFNLAISNVTGYDPYSQNFTLSAKTDWTVALIEESESESADTKVKGGEGATTEVTVPNLRWYLHQIRLFLWRNWLALLILVFVIALALVIRNEQQKEQRKKIGRID